MPVDNIVPAGEPAKTEIKKKSPPGETPQAVKKCSCLENNRLNKETVDYIIEQSNSPALKRIKESMLLNETWAQRLYKKVSLLAFWQWSLDIRYFLTYHNEIRDNEVKSIADTYIAAFIFKNRIRGEFVFIYPIEESKTDESIAFMQNGGIAVWDLIPDDSSPSLIFADVGPRARLQSDPLQASRYIVDIPGEINLFIFENTELEQFSPPVLMPIRKFITEYDSYRSTMQRYNIFLPLLNANNILVYQKKDHLTNALFEKAIKKFSSLKLWVRCNQAYCFTSGFMEGALLYAIMGNLEKYGILAVCVFSLRFLSIMSSQLAARRAARTTAAIQQAEKNISVAPHKIIMAIKQVQRWIAHSNMLSAVILLLLYPAFYDRIVKFMQQVPQPFLQKYLPLVILSILYITNELLLLWTYYFEDTNNYRLIKNIVKEDELFRKNIPLLKAFEFSRELNFSLFGLAAGLICKHFFSRIGFIAALILGFAGAMSKIIYAVLLRDYSAKLVCKHGVLENVRGDGGYEAIIVRERWRGDARVISGEAAESKWLKIALKTGQNSFSESSEKFSALYINDSKFEIVLENADKFLEIKIIPRFCLFAVKKYKISILNIISSDKIVLYLYLYQKNISYKILRNASNILKKIAFQTN